MNTGYSDKEYARVRAWLLSAFEVAPAVFTEAEMIEKLRSGEWLLVTTEVGAAVLQFFVDEDENNAANVLVVGGKKNGSVRELMALMEATCAALRQMGFAYLCGTPRQEFYKYLIKHGWKNAGKDELIKRL